MACREGWRNQFSVEHARLLAWSLCGRSPPGHLAGIAITTSEKGLTCPKKASPRPLRREAKRNGQHQALEFERSRARAILTYTTRRHA